MIARRAGTPALAIQLRHGRACPGHPRSWPQDVDARLKAGHDDKRSDRPELLYGTVEFAPFLFPDVLGIEHDDRDLHLVGELDRRTERIDRRQFAADLVLAEPAAARGRRENHRAD